VVLTIPVSASPQNNVNMGMQSMQLHLLCGFFNSVLKFKQFTECHGRGRRKFWLVSQV